MLLEREDVVDWHYHYLLAIKQKDFKKIIWSGETWVNIGHNERKGLTDGTLKGTITVPVGRGGKLIMIHAGSSQDFVPNALLFFFLLKHEIIMRK